MSYIEDVNIKWQDTGNVDAFGRARVSQLTTQFDMKQLHDNLPLFIDQEGSGATFTHDTVKAKTEISLAGSGWGVAQTKQRFNYQSGKSQLLFWTFYGFGVAGGQTKRIGYFSSSTTSPYTANLDGIFLENNDSGTYVKTYRNGTETSSVIRSDWNDPLDGTGESGINHDLANDNTILAIDYEWLGAGRIRYYIIKFGKLINFHYVDFTDTNDVYMSSPNQPMRWECRSGGGSMTMNYICGAVNTEGSINQIGKDGGVDDDGTHLDANNVNNWYIAIGLRLKSTNLDSVVDILDASLKSDTNDSFMYRIVFNPTYSGSLTWTDVDNYGVQYALGATANTVSDSGEIFRTGFGDQNSTIVFDLKSAIKLGSNLDGTRDEVFVIVKPHTSNLDIHRAINWRELT